MSCSSFLFPPSFFSFYEELRRCVRQSNNKTTRTTRVWVQQREEKRWSLSSPIIKPPFMHFSLSFYYPPFGAEKMLSISLLSKKKKFFFLLFFPRFNRDTQNWRLCCFSRVVGSFGGARGTTWSWRSLITGKHGGRFRYTFLLTVSFSLSSIL